MKKLASIVLILAFALCVVVLPQRVTVAQETFSKFVPDDVLFFKSSVGLEQTYGEITKSNFWKQFTGLRFWAEIGVTAGLESVAQGFAEEVGFELSTANIMSLFGKEFAIAVFLDAPEEKPGAERAVTEGAAGERAATEGAVVVVEGDDVVVTEEEEAVDEEEQVAPPMKIQAFLLCRGNPLGTAKNGITKFANFLKEQADDNAAFQESTYKGVKITSIKPAEGKAEFTYCFMDDVFAFGVGNTSPEIQRFVDLSKGEGNSLAASPHYQKVVASTKMAGGGRYAASMYFDMESFGKFSSMMQSVWAARMGGMAAMGMPQQKMPEMPIVLGGTGYYDKGITAKVVSFSKRELQNELFEMMKMATGVAEGVNIKYIPENAILYAAVNKVPDLEKMWPLLMKQWEQQGVAPMMNMVMEKIETGLGIKVADDILPWIGDEFAFAFSDLDTAGGFPYPKFAMMIKIKDKQKANAFLQNLGKLLEELVAQTGFKFEKTAYKSYSLNSVTISMPMPMPILLTPAYGVVDDFLIIGSNADLLKQMVDASKGTVKSLAADAAFKSLNIPAKTSATVFYNSARFMNVAKATAAWVVQITKEQPMMADSVKNAVDNYVIPIANCLSALKTVSFYQINEGNMSTLIYKLRVEDLPAR